jgi:sulfur-oxidizing protein SoxY
MRDPDELQLVRRQFLAGGVAVVGLALLPMAARAKPADVDASVADLFGDRSVSTGRVTLAVPRISENGYSVPLMVEVDSPMTRDDHVLRIAIFAEENPLPDVARFELGPRAGKAKVQTRIRMGGSQKIRAIAEMNDGSLWGSDTFSIVTLAACIIQ